MLARLRAGLRRDVCSLLDPHIALGTGGAYAANTVFSTDIVDGEVKHADLAGNAVTSTNIYNGSCPQRLELGNVRGRQLQGRRRVAHRRRPRQATP